MMLLDEFVTNQLRCWFAQEDIMNEELSEEERLAGAILAQQTNAKRSALIRELDRRFGDGDITVAEKSYTYFKDKKE